ncbi:MAG: hypothetical protein ACC682_12120 [Gemmatimonadota bacterium]
MTSNLQRLARVARKIEPLLGDVVFVGGAVIELYITRPVTEKVRPTKDIDVICQVSSLGEYRRLGKRLEELGFGQSAAEADPIFRWRSEDDILDVLPDDETVLGSTNPWFAPGLEHTQRVRLADDLEIRILSGPYLLATKLKAYGDRGKADPHMSEDLEDVVVLVAGRPEIVEEVAGAAEDLKDWLREHLDDAFPDEMIGEYVAAHLPSRNTPGLGDVVTARIARLRAG